AAPRHRRVVALRGLRRDPEAAARARRDRAARRVGLGLGARRARRARGHRVRTLAVVVLSWNGAALTRDTLRSLGACRVPEDWRLHVLVVDNASTDGSPQMVRDEFPDAELMALSENRRFAGGNNAGLKRALAAGADAAMLLNNDVVADPWMIEKLLGALAEHAGAGAAAPLIYFAPPTDRIWYGGGRCRPWLAHSSHRAIGE